MLQGYIHVSKKTTFRFSAATIDTNLAKLRFLPCRGMRNYAMGCTLQWTSKISWRDGSDTSWGCWGVVATLRWRTCAGSFELQATACSSGNQHKIEAVKNNVLEKKAATTVFPYLLPLHSFAFTTKWIKELLPHAWPKQHKQLDWWGSRMRHCLVQEIQGPIDLKANLRPGIKDHWWWPMWDLIKPRPHSNPKLCWHLSFINYCLTLSSPSVSYRPMEIAKIPRKPPGEWHKQVYWPHKVPLVGCTQMPELALLAFNHVHELHDSIWFVYLDLLHCLELKLGIMIFTGRSFVLTARKQNGILGSSCINFHRTICWLLIPEFVENSPPSRASSCALTESATKRLNYASFS